MKNLKEWAKYYQELGVWVLPYPSQTGWDSYWKRKSDKDYYNISKRWTWNEDKGLHLVLGRKGVRVIELLKKGCDEDTHKYLLKALTFLRLSNDYSWIIESKDKLGIVISTLEDFIGIDKSWNGYHGRDLLINEGYYVLPPSNRAIKFYKDRLPSKFPSTVEFDVLFRYVEDTVEKNRDTPNNPLDSIDNNVITSLRNTYIEVELLDSKGEYFCCKTIDSWHDNPHFVIVRSNGEEVDFNRYTYFESPFVYYDNSHLLTSENRKFGFVSVEGYASIPFKYDQIKLRKDGYFDVRIGKRWGILAIDGREILPVKYTFPMPKKLNQNIIVRDADSYCFGVVDMTGKEIIPCIYEHLFKSNDNNLFFFVYDGDADDEYESHSFESFMEHSGICSGVVNNKGEQIITTKNTFLKLYSKFILEGQGGTYKSYPSDTVYNLYTKQGELLIGGFKEFYYDETHDIFFFFYGGIFECGGEHWCDIDNGRDYYDYHEKFDYGDNLWLILDKDLNTVIRDELGEQMHFEKGFIGKVNIINDGRKKTYEYNFPSKYMVKITSDSIQALLYKWKNQSLEDDNSILINDDTQLLNLETGIITKI